MEPCKGHAAPASGEATAGLLGPGAGAGIAPGLHGPRAAGHAPAFDRLPRAALRPPAGWRQPPAPACAGGVCIGLTWARLWFAWASATRTAARGLLSLMPSAAGHPMLGRRQMPPEASPAPP